MSYQVIARKYRPRTFAEVVGQRAVVTTLKNSLIQERTAHAYLFCGSRGTGKTTLARLLAKALNCEKRSLEGEPCGTCQSCMAIVAGRSLDVLEIDGASNRGIDDIRQINETVAYASSSGKWKIYIIDEVHMLTKEAFNALLKTLEEPPKNVKFFFATTESQKVPETILSRCQRFELCRIGEEESVQKLLTICQDLQRDVDIGALRLIAHRSNGGLRDAESMLDQILSYTQDKIDTTMVADHLGLPPQRYFFALDAHFAKADSSFAITLTEELFEAGCDPTLFLEGLSEHYRLLLVLSYNPSQLEGKSFSWLDASTKRSYSASSSFYTTEQCLFILEHIVEWLQKINKSPYPRLVLEMVLITILRSRYRLSLDTLVHRLTLLEKSLSPTEPIQDFHQQTHTLRDPQKTVEPPQNQECTTRHLSISQQQSPTPKESQKVIEPLETQAPLAIDQLRRHETIMRFAAVELEGTIKKSP
ncbi:MAG: DNA polymerase III subunit gamma/tau [Simkania sp.]|nr:DNA polymerase III subunit gamma/tau [Simkania sp.]